MSNHHPSVLKNPKHVQACAWLIAATAFWGLSFPFIRSSWLLQKQLSPEIEDSSFFFAATLAVVRFSVAGLLIAMFCARTLPRLTRLELEQGLVLGVFGGLGIVFQMDGLAHIAPHAAASTSAFLTQFTCLLVPVWVACQKRTLPRFAVIVSCFMVLIGVAVLADFNWREFKMGRGEAETLLSAVFFSGQILWLERPIYSGNRVAHFTVVMFATISLLIAPVAVFSAPSARAFAAAYSSGASLALIAGIVLLCTVMAYTMMNVWQPHVTATEAGLIYCVEPIYASLFAAYLPGWISRFAQIDYPNERLTNNLLIGGALITVANVLMQVEAMRQRRKAEPTNGSGQVT